MIDANDIDDLIEDYDSKNVDEVRSELNEQDFSQEECERIAAYERAHEARVTLLRDRRLAEQLPDEEVPAEDEVEAMADTEDESDESDDNENFETVDAVSEGDDLDDSDADDADVEADVADNAESAVIEPDPDREVEDSDAADDETDSDEVMGSDADLPDAEEVVAPENPSDESVVSPEPVREADAEPPTGAFDDSDPETDAYADEEFTAGPLSPDEEENVINPVDPDNSDRPELPEVTIRANEHKVGPHWFRYLGDIRRVRLNKRVADAVESGAATIIKRHDSDSEDADTDDE